ncbi:MAG: antibiotic biosynthesis monooxygenase [Clostridium sp.]|nr:antibiotic biosynthesis monooxygenase [Clostridium sp.]
MFVLHVTFEVKEGKREELLKVLSELQVAEETRKEAGNYDYTYYLPADGRNIVFLTELWESREHQQNHLQSDHIKKWAAVKGEYVENTVLKMYDGAVEVQ